RQDPAIAAVTRNHLLWLDETARAFRAPAAAAAAAVRTIPNDPAYPFQAWHYALIDLPRAWSITKGSSAVLVAVVDDGIRVDHPGQDHQCESRRLLQRPDAAQRDRQRRKHGRPHRGGSGKRRYFGAALSVRLPGSLGRRRRRPRWSSHRVLQLRSSGRHPSSGGELRVWRCDRWGLFHGVGLSEGLARLRLFRGHVDGDAACRGRGGFGLSPDAVA